MGDGKRIQKSHMTRVRFMKKGMKWREDTNGWTDREAGVLGCSSKKVTLHVISQTELAESCA